MLHILATFFSRIRFCRPLAGLPPGTLVFFPVDRARLCCGIAGILEIVRDEPGHGPDPKAAERVAERPGAGVTEEDAIATVESLVGELRRPEVFPALCADEGLRGRLVALADRLSAGVAAAERALEAGDPAFPVEAQEAMNRRLVRLRDAAWALRNEQVANVERVADLLAGRKATAKALGELRKTNLVLNGLDRLEVRGRDSAGILFQISCGGPRALSTVLDRHAAEVGRRAALADFPDRALAVSEDRRTVTLVYKVAAEVGELGDNVSALRKSIRADDLLHDLLGLPGGRVVLAAHTRWASNGIINLPNCHPLDNEAASAEGATSRAPRVHVALNGDIDNYLELKARYEDETGLRVSERITTDAKVIALWIDRYLRAGHDLRESFRLAVRDFEGSAAILMASDLDPGRLYLSLKGSGQSLYVGLAPRGYLVASEIYGLVEETPRYLAMDGLEGQVFVLSEESAGQAEAVEAFTHEGSPPAAGAGRVRTAEITTRDVDRGDFPHYFLKEVSQAPESVAKTLRGKFARDGSCLLGPETIPPELHRLLRERRLTRVVAVGQGTAAVAAEAAARFLSEALRGSGIRVEHMKASELSGFELERDMTGTLVVAVTQSGSTADTNRAVDLARQHGALTLAIVNRRNSAITDKTAGVLYTSDGRDVEMSVASTKAFYSQVAAGAVLALAVGRAAGTLGEARVRTEIQGLRALPDLLREVVALGPRIRAVAERWAPTRRYWAVVGSGPNRTAAEEVRIKLSELCYKSISADSVEDKKHIDLSSESLILVLAAGHEDAVLSDLAKDVAIFKAHRAVPIVFVTRGDRRFDSYAAEVVELPPAPPLLSMVLATMAGHLFGYHAAIAIDEGGRFLGRVRSAVVSALDRRRLPPPGEMARFEREFRERLFARRFASALEAETAVTLNLLLLGASGVLPPIALSGLRGGEFETADLHAALLERLVEAVDQTIRPVDAIKHQAKIVTVGTSRPEAQPSGPVFDALAAARVPLSAVTFADRALLSDVQIAVREVAGVSRYEVTGLDPDGSPEVGARIRLVERTGLALDIASRAEQVVALKGTKRTVVKDRRAFIGIGAKDGRLIAIVPLVDHRFTVTTLALLHLSFRPDMTIEEKRLALGEKYDRLVNGVTEADVPWKDEYLGSIPPEVLLTTPPARLAERLVAGSGPGPAV
ncbi:MAG: SIS domain-containing protein [Planctomycetes bacterium]|jgi:glucosamine--fructose-6-phosphate aminotransferase (isomerizing)|nr:SIS domain-containing protein [Planctomycetota bacterium]